MRDRGCGFVDFADLGGFVGWLVVRIGTSLWVDFEGTRLEVLVFIYSLCSWRDESSDDGISAVLWVRDNGMATLQLMDGMKAAPEVNFRQEMSTMLTVNVHLHSHCVYISPPQMPQLSGHPGVLVCHYDPLVTLQCHPAVKIFSTASGSMQTP